MRKDGKARWFGCALETPPPNDSDDALIAACIAERLKALGAKDVAVSGALINGRATWDQLSIVNFPELHCMPNCADGDCDYCNDLPEAECLGDAFCGSRRGNPVNLVDQCLEPERFAGCWPAVEPRTQCDTAETVATSADGLCWHFTSICYDPGFDYNVEDPNCRYDLPECEGTAGSDLDAGSNPDPNSICAAQDINEGEAGPCDPANPWGWDGSSCQRIAVCPCVTEDCGVLSSTKEECEAKWAVCTAPACDDKRVPKSLDQSFAGPPPSEAELIAYADWTSAIWHGPTPLPIDPVGCEPIDGLASSPCPVPQGISFERDGEQVVDMDIGLEDWGVMSQFEGVEVEFRLINGALMVREVTSAWPLLFAIYDHADEVIPTPWELSPIELKIGEPFCVRSPVDNACNELDVLQNLLVTSPTNSDGTTQEFTLEPYREQKFTAYVGIDALRFHVVHGMSIYPGQAVPGGPGCDQQGVHRDAITVVRVPADYVQ
jgi:hypothetical protein